MRPCRAGFPENAMPTELLGLILDELRALAVEWGQPAYRGNQIYRAIYQQRQLNLAQISTLPRGFRQYLAQEASVGLPGIQKRYVSSDETIRYLLGLADGKSIETVWMPDAHRQTLCLSTQAGCAVNCHFCATAQLGLLRNLTAGEIVGQALVALGDNRERLKPNTNVVLMGQGEPLLNYEATLRAVHLMAEPAGMNIPLRKITLSTSGIIPGIRRLAEEAERPKLAVSLSGTTEEQRSALMPINHKYPLAELMEACRAYPLRPWERLTFEYVLLGGVNDSDEDARRVAKLVDGLRAKINLIPWNPAPGLPYRASEEERVAAFQRILRGAGLLAFVRKPRGQDIFAACGQLASLETPLAQPVPAANPAPAD